MIRLPTQPLQCQHFIGGEWHTGQGSPFEIISPYHGAVAGRGHHATDEEIQTALSRAKEASLQWKATPPKERAAVLFRFR